MTGLALAALRPEAGGDGQFLGVDWGLFAIVFVAALVGGVVIVTLYALGLRLRAAGLGPEDGTAGATRPPLLVLAWVCFVLAAIGVLYGLYLVIPQFHG